MLNGSHWEIGAIIANFLLLMPFVASLIKKATDLMTIRTLFLLLLLLASGTEALAQKKIKYKDLYPLLEARRYDDAEPFLRDFLVQEPNFANAVYNMAKLYDLRAREADVLKEIDHRTAYADSAIVFYHRTNALIDEKELKKNDDYWQEFNRRDLRTGKFGISLSDVQFSLDQKIEEVKTIKSLGQQLHGHFVAFTGAYDSCQSIYATAKEQYGPFDVLRLAGSQTIDEDFKVLKEQYDTFQIRFNSYKNTLSEMEDPGYRQRLKTIGIDDFPQDPINQPDYYSAEILAFNFKDWVKELEEDQDDFIMPLFKDIDAFQRKLDEMKERIGSDSLLTDAELPDAIDESLLTDIRRVDEFTSMEPYFNIQCRWMDYQYVVSPVYHPSWLDSARFGRQLSLREEALGVLEVAQGLIEGMARYEPADEYRKYERFLAQEHGGFDAYAQLLAEWDATFKSEVARLQEEMQAWKELASWAYSETDTVYVGEPADLTIPSLTWYTVQSQALDSTLYVTGIKADASEAFLSLLSADRKILWLTPVSLASLEVAVQDPESIELMTTDVRDGDPVILSMMPAYDASGTEYIKGVMAKVRLSDGTIEWQNVVRLAQVPLSLRYDPASGEIIAAMGERMDEIVVFNPDGSVRE